MRRQFGEANAGDSQMPHVGTGAISRLFEGTSVMSSEMREWVGRVLYPGDALLHRFFCGAGGRTREGKTPRGTL